MINFSKFLKKNSADEYYNSDMVLCRLMVPKNNDRTPAAAELLFAALHGTYDYSSRKQPIMSFEIVSVNKFIQFYFYVPRYLKEFVEGQFYAQYPTVEIATADDYALLTAERKYVVGTEMQTTKDDVFPLKTFQSFEADPLSGITGVLNSIDSNDEVWIQLCISPIDDSWQKKAINYTKTIRAGRDPGESFWKSFARDVISSGRTTASGTPVAPEAKEVSGPMQLALKGIEEKTTKLGFKTSIRIACSSSDYSKAKRKLNAVVGAFKQYNTVNMNGLIQGIATEGDLILNQYKQRAMGTNPFILNIEEIASIYHLPSESVVTPTMDWAGAKKGEPPQNLPVIEGNGDDDVTVVGKTNFRGAEKNFGLKMKDRALHVYAIGKTGTGKSTLLSGMILDDIYKGRGVAVVDPHGDLVRDVLDYIPKEREQDVVFFSPADRNFPIGFNLLESVDPEYKNLVSSGIVSVFKKIFGESWGPRLEYILRNVVLGLLDYPDATLLSILKVLTDTKFRRDVIDKISDPIIRDFFLNEFERYDQKFRTEAVAPIQNKVGQFLSSTVIRNIVGQEKSTVDIRQIMDTSKILLLDLSIGKIGEDNSALLGSMMITKIQMAAMTRADLPKEQRVPFYLYVDEFQNFATDSFAVILSEARKYGLSLMVTNQYIAQMPETVANAVFGNVGTLICFRVGAGDAEALQREFVPVFEAGDLTNLDNYNIYIKMAINGVTSTPFSSKTLLPNYPKSENVEGIIEASRQKYSKPREEVEVQITNKTLGSSATQSLSTNAEGESASDKEKKSDDKQKDQAQGGGVAEKDEIIDQQINSDGGVAQDSGEGEELPKELQGYKSAEDYDINKWYFINRTNFRTLSGKSSPEEEAGGVAEKGSKKEEKEEPKEKDSKATAKQEK
ncbi:MAG: AAA-like domain protein [candidate division WS2 bacterium ADurb.Bin280]|uniref:AAA-like domain protein n=1 Tax=candidate division WS2 bacterium ADurb.Bin280 TaxID=1852829 RepID=A0A1V5SG17_9BACT|nr:MAG: AAA-like domain protein [candidate division WS2 bacterium ADurb.Bin280]